jgi:Ca2+-transporting ATPase
VVNQARAAKRRWWQQKNSAFWAVALSAITMLAVVTWAEAPGRWFRFAPPPPGLWAVAVLMPLSALGLIEAVRRRVSALRATA